MKSPKFGIRMRKNAPPLWGSHDEQGEAAARFGGVLHAFNILFKCFERNAKTPTESLSIA